MWSEQSAAQVSEFSKIKPFHSSHCAFMQKSVYNETMGVALADMCHLDYELRKLKSAISRSPQN